MRLPVWNKPRIIGCAENYSQQIGLPRGCLETVLDLLQENNIRAELQDERLAGRRVTAKFTGTLRKDQKTAVREMLKYDVGVLCAPTAFGKTVTAAALITRRKVSTLILVHRTELQRQWQERLTGFLEIPKGGLGVIGGGKKKPSGKIDIAVMQSLSRREDLGELLDQYGQIIIDECHHLSAFSFEAILKQAKAKFVVGLTATPIRRDGHQPIIFMQCGPIRHSASRPETAPAQLEVWPKVLPASEIPPDSPIQDVFRILANDSTRNRRIFEDVLTAYREGRKVLVLTERTDHLPLLREAPGDEVEHCFVLHGRLSKKQRATVFAELDALEESAPRVLLATGRLIGEGFDHLRDVANLRNLAVFLLTNNTRLTSVNKLKSNFSISQDKTENYLSAILESYLTFQLQKFSWSLKSVQRAGFKPYAIDTGLRNRVAFSFSAAAGRLVENVVHNQLRRCQEEVCFGAEGRETDFIVKEGVSITRRIQIWYEDALQAEIPERELTAFGDLQRDAGQCLLLTNDLERDIEIGTTKVHCVPVVKYLLLGGGNEGGLKNNRQRPDFMPP